MLNQKAWRNTGSSSPVVRGLIACLLPKPEQKTERYFSCWDRGLREVSMHMDVDRKNLVQRSWWIQDRACLLSTHNRSEILLGGVFPFKSLPAAKPSLLSGRESSDLTYCGISWSTLSLRIILDCWAVPSTSMKWRGLSLGCHLSVGIRAWYCGAIIQTIPEPQPWAHGGVPFCLIFSTFPPNGSFSVCCRAARKDNRRL